MRARPAATRAWRWLVTVTAVVAVAANPGLGDGEARPAPPKPAQYSPSRAVKYWNQRRDYPQVRGLAIRVTSHIAVI